jgi:segregation and condensation protein A
VKPELRVIEGGVPAGGETPREVASGATAADAASAGHHHAEHMLPDPAPVQQEMPFAIVDGEPVTEPPKDLYIPPQALRVFLEAFEGPLDLLLYLIRKQNLDILDMPIAEITRQYMEYIDLMRELELELAGEYLLMAAMLAEIKSRMLLPRTASESVAEEDDPRAELVRRLQEYERYKKAAEDIDQLQRLERDTWQASAEVVERKVVKARAGSDAAGDAARVQGRDPAGGDVRPPPRAARAAVGPPAHDRHPRPAAEAPVRGVPRAVQRAEEGRMGVTVTFVAILELVREGLLEIVQAEPYAPLHVRAGAGRPPEDTAANDDAVEAAS